MIGRVHPVLFDPDQVVEALADNSFVKAVHVYRRLTSTNTLARRLAESGAATGTLVLAEQQTAGKGRMGRSWDSPEGLGLWFSLIFRPPELVFDYHLLPLILGEEIALAVEEQSGCRCAVKWPNDILLGERKICGILCESSYRQQQFEYMIAGIGINVNQTVADFPEALRDRATSLAIATGRLFDRLQLLRQVLARLQRRFSAAPENIADLRGWRRLCRDLGREVTLRVNDQEFTGIFENISPAGEMLLRLADGTLRRFSVSSWI